jgi:hypothetical protein
MSMTNDRSDLYWAIEEPDKLVESLKDHWENHGKFLRGSVYYRRILRNLAYYHDMFFDKVGEAINMEIKMSGEEGNQILAGIGHFRSLLDHIFQFAAGDRRALTGRAVNTDVKSMQQARLGTGIIDYYQRERGLEEVLRTAAVHALVFAQGFVMHTWDPDTGDPAEQEKAGIIDQIPDPQMAPMDQMAPMGGGLPVDGNPVPMMAETLPQGPKFKGDVVLRNPTALDVAWNCSRPWKEKKWVIVRTYENRWDLAAMYPEKHDEILTYEEEKQSALSFYTGIPEYLDEDQVPVFHFFHERTPAVPTGRYCQWIPDNWLRDTELPYKRIPVSRISAGEWVGTGTGWTPAFSLQAPQEMHNGEISSIITNHAAYASQGLWAPPGSERITILTPKKGPRIYSSPVKPEPLPFLSPNPELHKMEDRIVQHMQLISGVSGATRGIPEAGVTAGNALALLDAKSVQANSPFVYSYQKLGEEVATAVLQMFQQFATMERSVVVLGIHNMPHLETFTNNNLEMVDRVVVESVNPMTKTLAGKDAKAKDLISIGAIKNVEQYNQVYETGNLDPMFEADRAQLNVVRQENEALMLGESIEVMDVDYHSLHIREHQGVLSTMAVRRDPKVAANTLAHIMDHVMRSINPGSQVLQAIMGYQDISMFAMGMGQPAMSPMGGPTTTSNPGAPPKVQDGTGGETAPANPAEPNPMAPKQVPVPNQPPA